MEELIQFSYKGKQYTGNVLSSLDMTPHYYWVVFRQPELKAILGEEITFIVKDAMLKPVNTFLAQKNKELFQHIQAAMEKHLVAL
jgi:hypothetical protein